MHICTNTDASRFCSPSLRKYSCCTPWEILDDLRFVGTQLNRTSNMSEQPGKFCTARARSRKPGGVLVGLVAFDLQGGKILAESDSGNRLGSPTQKPTVCPLRGRIVKQPRIQKTRNSKSHKPRNPKPPKPPKPRANTLNLKPQKP